MVNASLISRLSQAVDQIENRLKQNHPWKVVEVRRGFREDGDAALDRHYAAHPEDFCDEEELADESQVCTAPVGQTCEEP